MTTDDLADRGRRRGPRPPRANPEEVIVRSRITVVGAVLIVVAASWASANPCRSERDDTGVEGMNLIAIAHPYVTICYDRDRPEDGRIGSLWARRALRIGREKYAINRPTARGRRLHITVFLPPHPTRWTFPGGAVNFCCWRRGDEYRGEVHYLAPSAPEWEGHQGGVPHPLPDYHAHYIVHEMMNLIHYSIDTAEYPASWVREGLAEYDGYMHTTRYGRTRAVEDLVSKVSRDDAGKIFCCRTAGNPARQTISTSSVYFGGAAVMYYFSLRFGERTHRQLFDEPIRDIIEENGTTVSRFFDEMRRWLHNPDRPMIDPSWPPAGWVRGRDEHRTR